MLGLSCMKMRQFLAHFLNENTKSYAFPRFAKRGWGLQTKYINWPNPFRREDDFQPRMLFIWRVVYM